MTLFSLREYLKDFESSLLVRCPPSCKVSRRFFSSCIASLRPFVVPRYSDANLVGKYLMYLWSLKLFSTPLITLDLSNKPKQFQRKISLESRVQHSVGWRLYILHNTVRALHSAQKYKESYSFAMFVPVLTKLCLLTLKI